MNLRDADWDRVRALSSDLLDWLGDEYGSAESICALASVLVSATRDALRFNRRRASAELSRMFAALARIEESDEAGCHETADRAEIAGRCAISLSASLRKLHRA